MQWVLPALLILGTLFAAVIGPMACDAFERVENQRAARIAAIEAMGE